MSRYLVERLPQGATPPADELHVRFTLDLPELEELRPTIDLALDWIHRHPDPAPTAIDSAIHLIQNFLPAPKPP